MRRLTLEAIHIIDTIARSGSFSAAAERLHKVPSTISYTINKLEEQMGLLFFERNGPRVTLTPIGKELLESGRSLLITADSLESKLHKMAQGVEVELNIVLDELLPLSIFVEDIKAFQGSYQNTRMSFQHEVLSGAWEALMQERADLVIAAGEGPAGGGYKTEVMDRLSFVFCVAPNHPLAEITRALHKSDLLQYVAIAIADSANSFPKRSPGLYYGQPQLTVDRLADKILLQKAGLGHGFLPRACVTEALEKGELIELEVLEPKADEVFYLAWRTGEKGKALAWWKERLSQKKLLKEHYLVK